MPPLDCDHIPYDAVIVNYRSAGQAAQLVNDFIKILNPPNHIYLIDNTAQGDHQELKELLPDIDITFNPKNTGFARAANQGWRMGDSPLVLFINPDVRLLQDDYSAMMLHMAQHPEVGALGPRILNPNGSLQGSARGFYSFWTFLAGRKGPLTKFRPQSGLVRKDLPLVKYNGKKPKRVDWVSGACILIKRQALEKLGGFDESFFMYFEDTSISRELLAMGLETHYFPEAVVSHEVGASSRHEPIKALWWFHQSWYRYLCKYHLQANPMGQAVAANIVGLRFCLAALMRLAKGWLKKYDS